MIKRCDICGKEFNAKGNRVKYCSDECISEVARIRQRNYRENMTSEQKEMEKQKEKVRYEKRYIKEKKKVDKRECLICKEEFTPNFNGAKTKYCSGVCSDEARRIRKREKWRKENGLCDKYDYEDIRNCKECNADISHMKINALYCSALCRQIYEDRRRGHKPLEEHLAIVGEQRKQRLARLEIEAKERQKQRAISNIAKLLNKEVLRREKVVELTRPCVECGTPFYNINPVPLTCSPLCSRRRKNRHGRLYNSNRLNESNIVDKDITVQKLFNKYDGVCYLCGEECDFDDKVITEEGYTIVGKSYPSIEHVIPISKGGLHFWGNVNLAHHYCNTLKSNKDIFKNKTFLK